MTKELAPVNYSHYLQTLQSANVRAKGEETNRTRIFIGLDDIYQILLFCGQFSLLNLQCVSLKFFNAIQLILSSRFYIFQRPHQTRTLNIFIYCYGGDGGDEYVNRSKNAKYT